MHRAVILAAGEGLRLRDVWTGPKGLYPLGGEALVARSVRLLRARGVTEITLVTGAQPEAWVAAAPELGVRRIHNPDWRSGALGSLQAALRAVEAPFLLLEGDLIYEPRALDAVLAHPASSALLVSGPTAATDEVWVSAVDGRLRGLSKRRDRLDHVVGELVGITRIGAELVPTLLAATGTSYDEDGLVAAAQVHPIAAVVVPDLCWGELDDAVHLRRLRTVVGPALGLSIDAAPS